MSPIPKDNLGYPVLVELDSGSSASGFYYQANDDMYFITARHVLFKQKSGNWEINSKQAVLTSYPPNLDWTNPTIFKLDLEKIVSNNGIKYDNDNDIAVVKISKKKEGTKNTFTCLSGVTKAKGQLEVVGTDPNLIQLFPNVAEGNDVYLYGYPTSLGMQEIPQIDYKKPLLRKGSIAQKNESLRTIIIDCPVYYGNSGGPVSEVVQTGALTYKFLIIGVVSEFVPFVEEWLNLKHGNKNIEYENSGYAVVVPIDFALTLIKSFTV